jgi:hypothetical protein
MYDMDWLTGLASIGSGGFLGSFLGIFTSLASTYVQYKEKLADNKHQLDLIKANSEATIREIDAQIEVQKIVTEGDVRVEEAESDTAESVGRNSLIERLTGKYLSDDILKTMITDTTKIGIFFKPFIYLHVIFMDAVRGLIRPILTVGIVWYVTYIIDMALEEYFLDDYASENLMVMVIKPAIQLILFSTSTVVSFWFADKSMSRRFQKGMK